MVGIGTTEVYKQPQVMKSRTRSQASMGFHPVTDIDPRLPVTTVGFAASKFRAYVSCRNPTPEYADGPDVHSCATADIDCAVTRVL
jgi:hypothetical protein